MSNISGKQLSTFLHKSDIPDIAGETEDLRFLQIQILNDGFHRLIDHVLCNPDLLRAFFCQMFSGICAQAVNRQIGMYVFGIDCCQNCFQQNLPLPLLLLIRYSKGRNFSASPSFFIILNILYFGNSYVVFYFMCITLRTYPQTLLLQLTQPRDPHGTQKVLLSAASFPT